MVASLPYEQVGDAMLVGAHLNGNAVRFVFDTGAFTSVVTPEAVRGLKLHTMQSFAGVMRGIGGSRALSLVSARQLQIDKLHGSNFNFVSAELGWGHRPGTPAGLLSTDFLSRFDIDLDVPERRIRLFLPSGDCHLPAAVLKGGLFEMPMLSMINSKTPRIVVSIGNHDFVAAIDTGAARTMMYRTTARRLGLKLQALKDDRRMSARGIGPDIVAGVIHVSEPITLGDLTIRHAPVAIVDQAAEPDIDLLLGADFLALVHVWISYSSKTVILQYPPKPSPAILN